MTQDQTSNVIAFAGNTMVYESVKRFAVKGLNDLIRVLMESVDDALFELSEKVENDQDRSMYFEAMREIRLKRKDILEKFDVELQDGFNRLILDPPVSGNDLQVDELSLVDQSEIEDRLAIDNMISKARPHFEDELYAVVERFKVVLHRKQVKDDQNPLDPKFICESFHLASAALDTDIKVKLIFYKLFDKFVMSNLGHFYQELNAYFIQKGVLPEFQAAQERMKQTTRFMSNRISRSYSESADKPQNQVTPTHSELSLEEEQPNLAGGMEGNLLAMLQKVLAPAHRNDTDLQNRVSPGRPVSREPGEVVGGMESAPVAVNPEAYLSALSQLQSSGVFSTPVASVDPRQLKTQLQQQLVTFKQQNSEQGNAAGNQIIDIVSMLFDFFFDDEALPDPIKVLIGRLQIPILKIAMLDNNFFNSKKHPARKLLDSISKASLGWSIDQHKEIILINKIEQIVEYLLQEFDQDISVFEQALEQFQQFLAEQDELIEQSVEQVLEQEQNREMEIQRAQQLASGFIRGLVSQHDLTFDVIDFLEGEWKSVLFNTLLTQGEDSIHWRNLKHITRTLIWTLIPKQDEQEKTKLLKTLPSLLRAMSKGLQLIQIDSEGQNKIFQMLVLEHAKTVRQTSHNLKHRHDVQTGPNESEREEDFSAMQTDAADDGTIDFELSSFETDGQENVVEEDRLTEIISATTLEVIKNLDGFSDSVNQGDIQVDDEMVTESSLQGSVSAESATLDDDFLEKVQAIQIGSWIEFNETDSKPVNARLSWKSNVTGKYVFVNRNGEKVKNMTSFILADHFRTGTARLIESVSVFDRAINALMSTLKH